MKGAVFVAGLLAATLLTPLSNSAAAAPPEAENGAATDEQSSVVEPVGTVHVELRMQTLPATLVEELTLLFEENLDRRAAAVGLRLDPMLTADVLIQVDISVVQPDGPVQVIQSVAVIDGEIAARGETQSCVRCEASELVERSLELLPHAVEALHEHRAAERAKAEEMAIVQSSANSTPNEHSRDSRRVRLGPVGHVGIVSSALGLGATIAGAVFLSRGVVVKEANVNLTTVDHRPAGWAMLGAGLSVMAVGNVLLAVDLGLLSRNRTRHSAGVTGLGLMVADGSGLVVSGRF